MPVSAFKKHIRDLNFSFISDRGESGVLLTANYHILPETIASPDILFALEIACVKFKADAVYFRYFQDGRAAVPQLYIFDYTHKPLSKEDRNRIHRNMWNGYQVPAYIIIEKSVVSVFDAREKPNENKEHYAEEIIKRTGDSIKSFNAQSFNDGLFWEEESNKKRFQFEQSATRDLIRGLKNVYEGFQKESNLDKHVALKLLIQSLLIKYLEERDEDTKSGYFAGTYFKKNFQCNNFCEVIRNGKLLDLLDLLASDFNGKIFEWDKETEGDARDAIQQAGVRYLAEYLDGNVQNGNYVLWRLYSFSHLPVEVISSVYEELLTDSKDIVYTPEMIVSTLVDECMPLKSPQKNFKLIDISCGSGIFLVKSYKRIVQWWRYEQWQKTGKLEKPSLTVLKDLLLNSVYGIDIQQDAIRLSIFSLALAVLDEVNLDPPTWEKLKFPDLSDNIVTKDFFEYITDNPPTDFSLVIGNPPFNLQFIDGKEPKRTKYFKDLKKEKGYQCEFNIPDENPALHFLVKSMNLLKSNALLCLIQPSGPLFYFKDTIFRKSLFSKYNLLQVIDLTKLADKLWGTTNVSTAAVFIQKSQPDNEDVLHLVANRTFPNLNRLFLEFDYYDFHYISKHAVINTPFIWKANLLGGGRLVNLVDRLSKIRTLKDYLSDKIVNHGWRYGEGYTVGNKKEYAPFIHNKISIKPKNIKESGIVKTSIEFQSHFEASRKAYKEIYLAPHILIKESIGKSIIPIELLDYDVVFSHEIIGIYAPPEQIEELRWLYKTLRLNNFLYRFYIIATSNNIIVKRATALLKSDIDKLPFPEKLNELAISEADRIIIDNVLFRQQDPNQNLYSKIVSIKELNEFANIFCKILNSVYQNQNMSFQVYKILYSGNYSAIHFEYSEKNITTIEEHITDLEQYIQETIPQSNANLQSAHIQKIMKVYGKDSIILVKPNQLRYWFTSIALRDADDTFADYIKARYYDA